MTVGDLINFCTQYGIDPFKCNIKVSENTKSNDLTIETLESTSILDLKPDQKKKELDLIIYKYEKDN